MEEGNSSLSRSPAVYVPLLRAILEDNWKAAEDFIKKNPNCLVAAITKDNDTALHFAAALKRTRFVKNLVSKMEPKQLELKANNGRTMALYFAAQTKIVKIAEVMVKKNKKLPSIFPKASIKNLPLYAAIVTGNRDMVSYLYSVTPIEDLVSSDRIKLLKAAISTDLYDTALKILNTFEEKKLHFWSDPLKMLARKPSEIGSKSQPSLWERCLYSC
ncbi:uncharacterized protein LOC122298705 [Carya illinoinensis]|uniref:uncharacterized protein LOC122298705 n=1 Tax=Carya illinoinensis TaxID=32201 RepID=UPI001C7221CE|nr:uncharacterized protein LOC122298705 [Carya illinoinensis]